MAAGGYRLARSLRLIEFAALIDYRPFRNTDPPQLAELWRSTDHERRGLMQPMSTALLEHYVLSKPYFDRHGLIVAEENGRAIGFGHAGFGANEDESKLSTELGVTCQIIVPAVATHPEVPAELLRHCEEFLRSRGARVLYGGSIWPLNPFYLGLYGGSELPGVLDSDVQAQELFRAHNYREVDRTVILERELGSFRPIVDRHQMMIRRSTSVTTVHDPQPRSWWEACTLGSFDRLRFELFNRGETSPVAQATFRTMEPLCSVCGIPAVGLVDLQVQSERRQQGLATYLVGEAIRSLQSQGITLVQVQTMHRNTAARALYAKLGFHEVDEGAVFRKE